MPREQPGTRVYRRLEREGRLTTTDWAQYNRHEVAFEPAHMSRRRLKRIQLELYRRTYSWRGIARRSTWRWPHALLYWPYNLNYRRGIRQFEDRYRRQLAEGLL